MRAAGGTTFVSGGALPLRIKALAPRSEMWGSAARSRVQATPSQSACSCRSPRRLALRCCCATLARGLHEGSTTDRERRAEIVVRSSSESSTGLLARCLATVMAPFEPATIWLQGEVGMGKSVFARGFIREATRNQTLEVVSPTFLLHQTYDLPLGVETEKSTIPARKIQHFDLYRFDPEKQLEVMLQRAYFDECLKRDVNLIEWAERLPGRHAHGERLVVTFEGSSDDILADDPYWRDFYGNDDDDYGDYYWDFYGGDDVDDDDEARASACRRIRLTAEGGSWTGIVAAMANALKEGSSPSLHLLAAKT